MKETHIFDFSMIDNRDSFEPKGPPEPSVDGEFQRELFASLMMLKPEETGLVLASTKASPVRDTVLSPDSPARGVEADGYVEKTGGALPADVAGGDQAALKQVETKGTIPSDAADAADAADEIETPEGIKKSTVDSIDEKVETSQRSKVKTNNAGEVGRNRQALGSGPEKAVITNTIEKEDAGEALKTEHKTDMVEGKTQEAKSGFEKTQKYVETGSSNEAGKDSAPKDGTLELNGEATKGPLKGEANIAKASAQAQANNNAIVGAINNKGSVNAPEIKVDIASLGSGAAQNTAAAAATTTASVKSAGLVRSATFDKFLIRQVSSKMSVTFKNNVGKATLTLNPPELGRLKVEIIMDQTMVKATIATENVLVRDALEANLPLLKEALQAQGLTVDDLNIMLGDGSVAYDDSTGTGFGERNGLMRNSEGDSTQESAKGVQNIRNDSLDIFI
jgi:flagellar hook-length control protein FliK